MTSKEQKGAFIPSYSYASQTQAPRLDSVLKSSASWIVVPAIAMAVSLGVSLPTPARAAQALGNDNNTVTLQNGAYGGNTYFTIANGVTISNYGGGSKPIYGDGSQNWTVNNAGVVAGANGNYAGITFANNGTVINSGTIESNSSNQIAIKILGTGRVVNSGLINLPNGTGVYIKTGSFTNTNTGTITVHQQQSSDYGVHIASDGAYVSNAGFIGNASAFRGYGVTIGNNGTVHNTGTIRGGIGIRANTGNYVYNSGLIVGNTRGIYLNTGTIVNFGTIIGSPNYGAVEFQNAGGSVLKLMPGSVLSGGAYARFGHYTNGSNGATFELSGTSAATISLQFGHQLNGAVKDFANIVVDSGANWTINGGGTLGSYATLTNNGTLLFNGTLEDGGRVINNNTGQAGLQFGTGNDALYLNGDSVTLAGLTADGGAGSNTLGFTRYESGTWTNGLSGSTAFTNFDTFTVKSGSRWNFGGSNTITAGDVLNVNGGFQNYGTLTVSGYMHNTGTFGRAFSGTASGVTLANGGTLNNSGRIQRTDIGVVGTGTGNTLINSGYIFGSTGTAVQFGSGNDLLQINIGASFNGTVDGGTGTDVLEFVTGNGGMLTNNFIGFETATVDSGASWVLAGNSTFGTINDFGVLANTGTITTTSAFNAGGTFNGTLVNGTVINAGTIIGNTGTAIQFGAGDDLLQIKTGAKFTGIVDGGAGTDVLEFVTGAGGTLSNVFSHIETAQVDSGANWVLSNYNTFANLTNAGTLTFSVSPGVKITGTATNSGSLSGKVTFAGGTFTNQAGGRMTGGSSNLALYTQSGTVLNYGYMAGSFTGVFMNAGTFINSGILKGTGASGAFTQGLSLYHSGAVTNTASGLITSATYGLYVDHGGTVTNAGTISGTGGTGVGIKVNNNIAATLINSGTITGASGTSVLFSGGDDLLKINTGAVFNGTVDGGAGTDIVELVTGNGGSLSNAFVNFETLTVDAAANWGLTGSSSFGTITDAGTLSNYGTLGATSGIADTGILTNHSSISGTVTLSGAGVLNNLSGAQISSATIGVVGTNQTFSNAGAIFGNDVTGTGVSFSNGGSIYNAATGTIKGRVGVSLAGAAGTITNLGTIHGAGSFAAGLAQGGYIHNQGTSSKISSGALGVYVKGATAAIINEGTISASASYGIGVQLELGGSINNSGLISGLSKGVYFAFGAGTINNSGTISGSVGVLGSYLVIDDTIVNSGAIIGNGGTAVSFGGGNDLLQIDTGASFTGIVDGGTGTDTLEFLASSHGSLTNTFTNFEIAKLDSAANWTLGGDNSFVTINNAGTLTTAGALADTGTFINTGSLLGTGQLVESGALNNSGYVGQTVTLTGSGALNNSGTINAATGVYRDGTGTGTLVNTGNITGTSGYGIQLASASTVKNGDASHTAATIGGYRAGIYFTSTAGTVTNYGTISGTAAGSQGITLNYGGVVDNKSTGVISGDAFGIGLIGAGTITNSGTITSASGAGVLLNAGGSFTNSGSSSYIYGGLFGVKGRGGVNVINNAGTILGDTGVAFTDNFGTYNNTVINTGTIKGTGGVALQFGAGDDLLELGPGAVFDGTIEGGAGNNTVELLSGVNFTGAASGFDGFSTFQIDNGASWTFNGTADTIAAGTTFTNQGSLDVTGTLTNAGVINGANGLTDSGAFTNTGSIGGTVVLDGIGTLNNSGVITAASGYGVFATAGSEGTLTNSGTITGVGDGIFLDNGGQVTNSGSASYISGAAGIKTQNATATIINEGTIIGTVGNGVYLAGGGSVTNEASGKISAYGHGVYIGGPGGTLTNSGTITAGSSGTGVILASGTLKNMGAASYIRGFDGVAVISGAGDIRNEGTIVGSNDGIDLFNSFNNTVANYGTITGSTAIRFGGGDDLLKIGTGSVLNGIADGGAGNDTLEFLANSSGTTSGFINFENFTLDTGSNWTFTNAVTIASGDTLNNHGTFAGSAWLADSGVINNYGLIAQTVVLSDGASLSNTGTITGTSRGVQGGSGSFTNDGVVRASVRYGVYFSGGGTFINGSTANTTAYVYGRLLGVFSKGPVTNYGTIVGSGGGVEVWPGTVDNRGLIQGNSGAGVSLAGASTLLNSGIVKSLTGNAVETSNGASYVYNAGGGAILGSYSGIAAIGQATINNAGTISGSMGIWAFHRNYDAVYNEKVTNSGTIIGNGGTAIHFVGGDDLLQIKTGSVITGSIDGGAGTDTLEFVTGNGGTFANSVVNFETLTVDSGANWVVSGNNSFDTLTNAGTLKNAGTLTVANGLYNSNIMSNAGSISGIVTLKGGSTLTNSGVITGGTFGVYSGFTSYHGSASTLVNLGTVQSTASSFGSYAVYMRAGQITNGDSSHTAATIVGSGGGIEIYRAGGSIRNYGTIQAAGSGTGIEIIVDGSVTNYAGASIIARGLGIAEFQGAATINNSGTIASQFSTGVAIASGSVTNSGTASYIHGGSYGVISGVGVASVAISNQGTIAGGLGGILFQAAYNDTVTNSGVINGGTNVAIKFAGADDLLRIETGSVIIGSIDGGAGTDTLEFVSGNGGTFANVITNFETAKVDAGAVWTFGSNATFYNFSDAGTFTNTGTLTSHGITVSGVLTNTGSINNTGSVSPAIDLTGSGSLNNSGIITGFYGVKAETASAAITNTGTITGSKSGSYGVDLAQGGVFTNTGSHSYVGGVAEGVLVAGAAGTITNAGTISGAKGIVLGDFNNTVANYGAIIGTGGTAVQFGSGDDLMKIGAGAYFNGIVDGGAGTDTLEFLASSSGSVSGFANFENTTLYTGTNWTFTGTTTVASGDTLTNMGTIIGSGSIVDAGYVDNSGSIGQTITLSGSGSLANGGTIGASIGVVGDNSASAAITNTGTIIGTGSVGISLANGGLITNGDTGHVTASIAGATYAIQLSGLVAGTLVNYGTIKSSGSGSAVLAFAETTILNKGVSSYIGGRYGVSLFSGAATTNTVTNYGTIKGTYAGVHTGGSADANIITNSGTASLISGGRYGIYIGARGDSITNQGTIIGTGTSGIGIAFINGFGTLDTTIVNSGKIVGNGGTAIQLLSGNDLVQVETGAVFGGTVDAGGGNDTLEFITGNGGTLSNDFLNFETATIDSGASWVLSGTSTFGTITDNGTLTNKGTLTSINGFTANGTVINTGAIIGNNGTAIQFGTGDDTLEVGNGASFSGIVDGGAGSDTLEFLANSSGSADGFSNFENTTLDTGASWTFSGDTTVASGDTLTNHGTFIGTGHLYDAGLVTNSGSIGQTVTLTGAGYLNNNGTITGADYGVYGLVGADGTFINTGLITGTSSAGVFLLNGGMVTNGDTAHTDARISGGVYGVYITGAPGTIVNYGTISTTGTKAISLKDGGAVYNHGLISGGGSALYISGTGYVHNSGTIANASNGIRFHGAGTLNNTGSISGSSAGVYAVGGASTINNSGTVSGNVAVLFSDAAGTYNNTLINSGALIGSGGTAVQFGAGNDTLELLAGGSFTGQVDGGAGNNTLEFGGTTAGTFTGLGGANLTNFGIVNVDSGASWTFTGNNTVDSGIVLTNAGTAIAGGTFTNAGSIDNTAGVFDVSGVLKNDSTITGVVTLIGSGSLNNTGYIGQVGGSIGVQGAGGSTSIITNSGSIFGRNASGIDLANGGTVANAATGVIYGGTDGIKVSTAAGIVTNYGSITGHSGIGVAMYARGTISNAGTAAYIHGATYGIKLGNGGSVSNAGTILSYSGVGIFANSGGGNTTIVNGSTANTGALIQGFTGGVNAYGTITVNITNFGTIKATDPSSTAVILGNGGTANHATLSNNGTASLIDGGSYGVTVNVAGGSVFNQGTITGGNVGVYMAMGGSITNALGATINGGFIGARITGAAGTITNYGTIQDTIRKGIYLGAGGTITNSDSAALITGGVGISATGGATKIVNSGTIIGTGSYAISFADGASTFNNTVINSGAINGASGHNAIQFGAGNDLLELDTGATFTGAVNGGAGINTLQFVSGTFANAPSFTNFQIVAIYDGASGTLTAYETVTTLTNSGTLINNATLTNTADFTNDQYFSNANSLINTGTIDNTGTFKNSGYVDTHTGYLTSSGTLINSGSIYGVVSMTGGSLNNAGAITIASGYSAIYAGGIGIVITNTGTVSNGNAASGTYAIHLADGGSITNGSTSATTALISGFGGIKVDGDPGHTTNFGTIQGLNSYGIYMTAGGDVTNSGTITGAYAAVEIRSAAGTVTNFGAISGGTGASVYLQAGGTVTNSGSVSYIAGPIGVHVEGAAGSVHNEGTIISTNGAGVVFSDAGGTFTNTLFNSGTVTGSGADAVVFGAGDDRVIVASGGVFNGLVEGGAGDNTVEFFSGTVDLSAIGTEYIDFDSVQVDSAATLDLSNGGSGTTIPSGFTLTNAGTLSNADTLTIDGVFNNTGSFNNTGTINSSGAGTFANTGSLDNSGVITGDPYGVVVGGTITNSGTLHGTVAGVNFTSDGTINNSGVISGDQYGAVIGAGTIINTGTIIDAGIAGASLGSGGTLDNDTGGLVAGTVGAVFTGTGASLTNNGTITGTSGVAVQFDAGVNTFTIGTGSVLNGTVDGGSGAGIVKFAGTGSIANTFANFGAGSAIDITSGASWTATGRWTAASVVNAGTLQPGTLTTPLKVIGNFSQTSSGVLQVGLDAGGTGSQLQVSGTAALDGNVAVIPSGTFVTGARKYTIITATGGVSGRFDGVTGGTLLLTPSLSYDAKDAFVTLTQQDASSGGGTGGGGTTPPGLKETRNEFAVAKAFDIGHKADSAKFVSALLGLDQFTKAADLKSALDRMSGENNADISTAALLAGRQFINQFQQHSLLTRDTSDVWDVWGSFYTQTGRLDGDGNTHDMRGGATGGAGGVDYRISPSFRIGASLGYGSSHFDLSENTGRGRLNYTDVAVTGDYTDGATYATGLLGGAFGTGSTSRDVSLPGLPARATAHVSNSQFLAAFEVGHKLWLDDDWTVTPFAGLDIGAVDQQGFTEKGTGALNLQVAGDNQTGTQSILGARFGTDIPMGSILLNTDVKVGWSHEFSTSHTITQSFAGTPGTGFTIEGASLPGDSAVLGAGIATKVSETGQAYIRYDGEFGDKVQSHAFTAGFRFTW